MPKKKRKKQSWNSPCGWLKTETTNKLYSNLGQVIEVEHKTQPVLTLARGRGMRGL